MAVAARPDACQHDQLAFVAWSEEYLIQAELRGTDGLTLHGVPCILGAYNLGYVFFTHSEEGGVRNLGFAHPYVAHAPAETWNGPVTLGPITSWGSHDTLTSPVWDAEAQTLTTHSRFRGMGDAASRGVWGFEQGYTQLRYYELDMSYDDKYTPTVIFAAEGMAKLPPPPARK
jgi:hypothetical protein